MRDKIPECPKRTLLEGFWQVSNQDTFIKTGPKCKKRGKNADAFLF